MKNLLQQHFPLIRTREEIFNEIQCSPALRTIFYSWKDNKNREEFLDICSGVKGVKMLYDSFFKTILNPETVPSRLNWLLSLLLGTDVEVLEVLPQDNSRMADESSLVIMDIVVKLSNGSIVNVEMQKIGYRFPGERSACYSSDLLLRQYKKVREASTPEKPFTYRKIKSVYTIVFFEQSTAVFKDFPDVYLHHFQQQSDSGLEMELLQKYLFIPLDIFKQKRHNNGIKNDLDAWLTFLSSDEPEDIISVMEYSPEFREMYEDIYDVCRNMEGVMDMFSKELAILDRNTVQLMIDEMKEDMERQAKVLEEQAKVLEEQAKAIEEQAKAIEEQEKVLEEKDKLLTVEHERAENAERNLLRLASSVIKVRNEHPKWGYDQIAETCNCDATTVESILAILD